MQSTKDKIDKILGIGAGQTVDDLFEDLPQSEDEKNRNLDGLTTDPDQLQGILSTLDKNIHEDLDKVDEQLGIATAQKGNIAALTISDLTASMHEVEDLISVSKKIFMHVYEAIMSTELIDSELINSMSSLLTSIRNNITEFIDIYRDKQKFVEKVKLMYLDQQNKIELMKLKYELDVKRYAEKDKATAVDVDGNVVGGLSMSVEDITKMLDNIDIANVDDAKMLRQVRNAKENSSK